MSTEEPRDYDYYDDSMPPAPPEYTQLDNINSVYQGTHPNLPSPATSPVSDEKKMTSVDGRCQWNCARVMILVVSVVLLVAGVAVGVGWFVKHKTAGKCCLL